jgi:hypothetical protein
VTAPSINELLLSLPNDGEINIVRNVKRIEIVVRNGKKRHVGYIPEEYLMDSQFPVVLKLLDALMKTAFSASVHGEP